MIKLLTLNLWRYNDFDVRLLNIINLVKDKSPDVIFLQEVQIDESFSSLSQAEILKKNLPEYKYLIFSVIYEKDFQAGKKLEKPVQHGMAVLSKYPVLNSFEYFLHKNEGEIEPRSVLCFDLEINKEVYKFANIHFANKEAWAKNQLVEFLKFMHTRGEARIMVGDFNLYHLSEYFEVWKGYKLSFDFKKYFSYPKDNGCLDYALIPNEFKFINLEMLEDYVSDHKALIVSVN